MYNIMFIAGLVLAVIFLIISIILFFRNDVPKLMGNLTGHNAKKEVRHIQQKDKSNKLEMVNRTVGSPENSTARLLEREAVTLKLCSEDETGLLLEEREGPMPAIFEVLEDITEFYGQ